MVYRQTLNGIVNMFVLFILKTGYPDCEMTLAGRASSHLDLSWSQQEFNEYIYACFPVLRGVEFELCVVQQSKIIPLASDLDTPAKIKEAKRSCNTIFIRPLEDVRERCMQVKYYKQLYYLLVPYR